MEAIADRVTEGKTYIVRGYAMGRDGGIIIKGDTQLYDTAPLEVSAETRQLLNPASPYTPLRDKVVGKMITVEGKVIQKVSSKSTIIDVIGVLLGEGESAEVLLTDDSTLKVTRKVWEVVGWDLPYVPFPVGVTLLNGEMIEIKLPSEF
ncbi:unnamed protein product [Merluccius merluccius]